MQPEEGVILGHRLDDDDDVDVDDDVDCVDVEDDVDVDVGHGWEHHLQLGLLLRRRHLRIEFINNDTFPKRTKKHSSFAHCQNYSSISTPIFTYFLTTKCFFSYS